MKRETIWQVREIYGGGGKGLAGIEKNYEQSSTCVRVAGKTSICFRVITKFGPRCGMSPYLFNFAIKWTWWSDWFTKRRWGEESRRLTEIKESDLLVNYCLQIIPGRSWDDWRDYFGKDVGPQEDVEIRVCEKLKTFWTMKKMFNVRSVSLV